MTTVAELIDIKINSRILSFLEDPNNWKQTTCHINGEKVINENVRCSYTFNKHLIFYSKHVTNILNNLNVSNKILDRELIKYETGGKFEKHKDHKINYEHSYVGLIYIPSDHIGGDLIIYQENGNKKIIKTSSDKFKLVIFNVNLYHESTSVEYGRKYVIKFPIFNKDNSVVDYFVDDQLSD